MNLVTFICEEILTEKHSELAVTFTVTKLTKIEKKFWKKIPCAATRSAVEGFCLFKKTTTKRTE